MKKISNDFIRICISGINGRMGHELIRALYNKSNGIKLTAGLVSLNSKLCGKDVGELIGFKELGVIIHDDLADIKDDFDILIDFTQPQATLKHIDFCRYYNKNMVIGTTGFTDSQLDIIGEAARQIGIVLSANFSIGINVMLIVLQKITKIVGKYFDIDIIDMHHREKIDAPSGTALAMKDSIVSSLGKGKDFVKCLTYNCMQHRDIRQLNSIGMTAIRTGDVVGEHTVFFSGQGERLEIAHKASNRMIYAIGAVRAALWLNNNKIGLYDMSNVLDLNIL